MSRNPPPHPALTLALILALCSTLVPRPLLAQSAEEILRLVEAGRHDDAARALQGGLQRRPQDPHLRFIQAIVLAQQDQVGQAMAMLHQLTRDFPELPEPYNNLAVLQAGQGDYQGAIANLQKAIRLKPDYLTAHENLGNIYVELAAQSYEKASHMLTGPSPVSTRLTVLRKMSTGHAHDAMEAQALMREPPIRRLGP